MKVPIPAADLAELSSLLDQALDMAPSEREAWLAEALSGELAHLGPTLRQLLAKEASHKTDDLIDRLPSFTVAAAPAASSTLTAGETVGPYRLLEPLGQGGMGAVWLAERADGSLKRKVALKLPHLGWTAGLTDRFAREREILAGLDHPHVARLYDAGIDERGRPWMAIEYVRGEPLDAYCRRLGLSLAARLKLLLQVADAVAFAHSRLVLHRDLKPANMLVGGDGQVKLLDFGIAKLMAGDSAPETELTQLSGRALTLDYASPEQIRGDPLSTASDVYSLGVVAYELLCGARPYQLKRGSAAELEEAILAAHVPPASMRVEQPSHRQQLRGDLDAVLAQALSKQPSERYTTIEALAQDWRRYLAGQRVSARAETPIARALRWWRRWRREALLVAAVAVAFGVALGVGATALLVLLLVAGLGASLWQAKQVARQRDRALAMAERNAAGNQFIETLLTRAARGGAFTAKQLLERSVGLIDSDVKANPEHRAFVLGLVANAYIGLDQPAAALPLLERALKTAPRGLQDAALHDMLVLRHASAVGSIGRIDEAAAAIDALLARADLDPALRWEAHARRGAVAQQNGEFADVLHHAEAAMAAWRATPRAPPHAEPALLSDLGWACLKNGRGDEAQRHYELSVAAFEALGLSDSIQALASGGHRAMMYQELGDARRAVEVYDELLATWSRADPDVPPSIYLLANRAYSLAQIGRFDEAVAGYERSARLAFEQGHGLLGYNIRMLRVELEAQRRRPDAARAELTAAEAQRDIDLPPGGPAQFAKQLAEAQLALAEGRGADALGVFNQALENRWLSMGSANALLGRCAAHLLMGALDAADRDARDALDMARALQGTRQASFLSGRAWLACARVRAAQGDAAAAARDARTALTQLEPMVSSDHPALMLARDMLSNSQAAL